MDRRAKRENRRQKMCKESTQRDGKVITDPSRGKQRKLLPKWNSTSRAKIGQRERKKEKKKNVQVYKRSVMTFPKLSVVVLEDIKESNE